jgi:Chitobiase/beta-hexosaminidase C-terminal domain
MGMSSRLKRIFLIFLAMMLLLFISIIASNGQSVNYYYDDLNRLIRIDYGDTVIDYTYDDVGNRETENIAHPPTTTANPLGGVYGTSQSVTLACTDPQGPGCANIYYTTDGSTPTTTSPVYSSPILISSTTTLKYFARDLSVPPVNETVKTQVYTIDAGPPAPNPMTWTSMPYQSGTGSISMVSTTATDPVLPISYYFDFVDSPTGGTGGTDSIWQSGTSYLNSGLQANHQYGYRVKARDGANNETAYSTPTQYAYTAIESPTGITFGTVTATSIQAQSANTPSGLTRGSSGLFIENTTNAANSGWKQNNDFWNSGSLSPNASYSFRAKAKNGDSLETIYCSPASKYTLANAPGTASFSGVTQTCITANWTANGNPGGTQYFCENTTAGTNSGWISNTSWNSCGLTCGTSYSFRVKARNGEGVETGWTTLGNQSTGSCMQITVTSPNGGETWPIGSNKTITWTSSGITGNVKIELSRNGGSTWTTIKSSTPNDGEYVWKVTSPATTQARIRVTSISYPSVSDTSDGNFTIQ